MSQKACFIIAYMLLAVAFICFATGVSVAKHLVITCNYRVSIDLCRFTGLIVFILAYCFVIVGLLKGRK